MSDDDRYIEVTATIGPIEPPYKLHTCDGGGEVHDTVHGDRAQRLFEVIVDADEDAGCSARIVTQEELDQPPYHEVVDALGDAFDGSLVEGVRRVRTERDRLRAVVDAEDLGQVAAERDALRSFVAELCNDCNHPRVDHAFRGEPDACAWQLCSCRGHVADALDGRDVMGGEGAT